MQLILQSPGRPLRAAPGSCRGNYSVALLPLLLLHFLLCPADSRAQQLAIGARQGGKWGFVDQKGRWIIRPRFELVGDLMDGRYFLIYRQARDSAARLRGEREVGLGDIQGHVVLEPAWDYISIGGGGMVLAAHGDSIYYFGLDNRKFLPHHFLRDDRQPAGHFSEGRAAVLNAEGKWGYIDTKGRLAVPYQYDEVAPFRDSAARVVSNGRAWYIDPDGRELAGYIPRAMPGPPFRIFEYHFFKGALNSRGDTLVQPIYDELWYDPAAHLFRLRKYYKYGLADTNGKILVAPLYNRLMPFSDGRSVVWKDGTAQFGYIDTTGTLVVPLRYPFVRDYSYGYAAVQYGGKVGLMDKSGRWAIPPKFEDMGDRIQPVAAGSGKP